MANIQSGEAEIVPQNTESYEKTEEVLALLNILVLGRRHVAEGRLTPADQVREKIRLPRSAE
ncbi:MAG: hypothetical protein F4029_15690 [Gammaproteobacteria bacterium]|nr:hypothetical protein [Gammaproteobacteria bacterium]MXY56121.1 hypothetical protein [Gammaproteobacteria bacterium]MYF28712.1 hypothetical protein [Gammaproteobacteria bacterium]MYK47659.1 hypothetical protein [Gammaproteobacteria bacterium]